MRISRKLLRFVVLSFLLILVLGSGIWAFYSVSNTWNDPKTWTTQDRLIIPSVAQDLRVSVSGNLQDGDFSAQVDYCSLYQGDYTPDAITLHCSLLPNYYTEKVKEGTQTWNTQTDVLLKITKSDPAPTEYLGRFDRTFTSVQAVGTLAANPIPVRITVQGTAHKPNATLFSMINHALKSWSGQKESISVTLTSYAVTSLAHPSENQIHAYAEKWAEQVAQELDDHMNVASLQKKTSQELLNTMGGMFSYQELKCHDLTTCEVAYQENPAVNMMYYLYTVKSRNIAFYTQLREALYTQMFPFVQKRAYPPSDNCVTDTAGHQTCNPDWAVMQAYSFPICPVQDIYSGKPGTASEWFRAYMDGSRTGDTSNESVANVMKILTTYKATTYLTTSDFDANVVLSLDEGCYIVAGYSKIQPTPELRKKVLEVYLDMLSTVLNTKITLDKKTLEAAIFEQSALSPYKTNLVADYGLQTSRENTSLQSSKNAAASYDEYRSIIGSLILLYLYESGT